MMGLFSFFRKKPAFEESALPPLGSMASGNGSPFASLDTPREPFSPLSNPLSPSFERPQSFSQAEMQTVLAKLDLILARLEQLSARLERLEQANQQQPQQVYQPLRRW